MNMKKGILYAVILLLGSTATMMGQDKIEWQDWTSGINKGQQQKKKYIVDLYTDWCGWCKKMDKTTFQDSFITDYISEHYVAIKFNAEQREPITFKNEEYVFTKGGRRGYHALAAKITNSQLRYPTIVFLDENANVIQAIPGFQSPENLERIMTYFAEDHHKTTPWVVYQRNYQRELKPQSLEMKNMNHTKLVKGN